VAYSGDGVRPGRLQMRSSVDGTAHVLVLVGELDLSECSAVESELTRLESNGHERIVIDLGGLEFIDSTGIALLVAAMRRSEKDSGRLRFVPSQSPDVQRLLQICGLEDRLPLVDESEQG
jgi:anti-anti-sigma factor